MHGAAVGIRIGREGARIGKQRQANRRQCGAGKRGLVCGVRGRESNSDLGGNKPVVDFGVVTARGGLGVM